MEFTLNSRSDIEQLSEHFRQNKVVRVSDFLAKKDADALSTCVQQNKDFTNAFFLNGSNQELTDQKISALPRHEQQNLIRSIHQSAAQGVGFLYGRKKIEPYSQPSLTAELKAVFELMNSKNLQSLIEKITGENKIVKADAQVTRFRPGDFLTRHQDIVPGETRRFAYVIGLSDIWHPDWGGLLQFFERDGTTTTSLTPQFNSLSLFDVSEIHSVTAVTPFAPRNRYSITGWLRL